MAAGQRFQPAQASHGAVVRRSGTSYTSPRSALENPRGFYSTHVGEGNFDVQSALDGIGNDWELNRVEFKPILARAPCNLRFEPALTSTIATISSPTISLTLNVDCVGDSPVEEDAGAYFLCSSRRLRRSLFDAVHCGRSSS
jgi:hypothetical protein